MGNDAKPATICWLLRGEAVKESARCESIWQMLARDGYSLVKIVLKEGQEVTPEWLLEKLPHRTSVIFVSDTDPTWVADVVAAVRANLGTAPVAWLHDGKRLELVDMMSELGIDDIFSTSTPASEMRLRLRLRWQQAEQIHRMEHELKEQAARTTKSETTLKQREEFLSVCAHDLRSPLGLIQTSIGMVLQGDGKTVLSALHEELLSRAKRQAGQAIQLVNDLLDVMALEQGLKPRYRLFGLHELLKEFYKDYSLQADQKGVKFHYDNPIRDWRVLADSDRVHQLLQNLFVNALKFTESGKNIYLSVTPFIGRRKNDPPYPMIVIGVRDEGRGIPEKEMQNIFDRFTQVKDYSRKEGRGLGLTVAKQISTLHDGNIWVQSEEGKGSTFFVLFPHVISRPAERSSSSRIKRILIAEPSLPRREELYGKLEEWGYQPMFVRDGIETVTHLFHFSPDAVILSANLAKMDETDVAELIKREPAIAPLPLLFMTELGYPRKKQEDLRVDAILTAPLKKESFEATLKSCVEAGRPTKSAA